MDKKFIINNHNVSPSFIEDIRETFTERKYYNPRFYTNNSRYQRLRLLQDEKGNIYHENWIKRGIEKSTGDSYYKVTMVEENRLDIISMSIYGTPRYWWVIALANDIIDPFDVPVGTELRIPLIETLFNKGGILSND